MTGYCGLPAMSGLAPNNRMQATACGLAVRKSGVRRSPAAADGER